MDNGLENNTQSTDPVDSNEVKVTEPTVEPVVDAVVPTQTEAVVTTEEVAKQPEYTDPNAGISLPYEEKKETTNYDSNYNYNVNTNSGYQTGNHEDMDERPLTMGDWLLTILVMTLLPCVGIPMYFVWAFGQNGNVNRRNYCRAYLIVSAVALVIGIILVAVIGFGALTSLRYYY